ncbi:MAG: HEAT repeat domain-containing protein [Planctomycetales bacterium]|nr:HEAT repeat domain-containing protein [Planctomycetales bacterium]
MTHRAAKALALFGGIGGGIAGGCGGGAEVRTTPPPVPAEETSARLSQWAVTLREDPPDEFVAGPGAVHFHAWWQRKEAAADGLVGAGAAAVPTLAGLLRDGDPIPREWAAAILGEIAAPEAGDALRECLRRADVVAPVVVLALEGIGRRGEARDAALPGRFVGGAAMNDVPMDSREKRQVETAAVLQSAAAEAAARCGDASGVPILVENLRGGGWARRDAAIRLRRLAGTVFGYALDASREDQEAAIRKALEWFEREKATWKPAPGTGKTDKATHDIYEKRENR